MPTAVTCIYDGMEIGVLEALEVRKSKSDAWFLCVNCGERVRAHSSGGRTEAHFEHYERNPGCPYSHSDSYEYGGNPPNFHNNTETREAIEGQLQERIYLTYTRNAKLVSERKKKDHYTCQACGYHQVVVGASIIDCHHLNPLGSGNERITNLDELICLCPNCHRIAHTSKPPLSIEEIKEILRPKPSGEDDVD